MLSETTKADLDDFAFKKITQTQKDIMVMRDEFEKKLEENRSFNPSL